MVSRWRRSCAALVGAMSVSASALGAEPRPLCPTDKSRLGEALGCAPEGDDGGQLCRFRKGAAVGECTELPSCTEEIISRDVDFEAACDEWVGDVARCTFNLAGTRGVCALRPGSKFPNFEAPKAGAKPRYVSAAVGLGGAVGFDAAAKRHAGFVLDATFGVPFTYPSGFALLPVAGYVFGSGDAGKTHLFTLGGGAQVTLKRGVVPRFRYLIEGALGASGGERAQGLRHGLSATVWYGLVGVSLMHQVLSVNGTTEQQLQVLGTVDLLSWAEGAFR